MGAGFIYLIIVGLWVAYFLPRWINSHEEYSGKSVDKFQGLLDVVGRTVTGEDAYQEKDTPEQREQILHTRRITFAALSGLLAITLLLVTVGLLSTPLITVPLIGITLYVAMVRRQIANESKRSDVERREGAPSIYRSKYAELITKVSYEERRDEWVPLAERDRYQSSGITLLPKGSAASRDTWQPTSVPTPSYLSAPRVVTTRRVIDLTNPGAWSAAQEELDPREALAPKPDQIFDQEVAEVVAERIERLRRAN